MTSGGELFENQAGLDLMAKLVSSYYPADAVIFRPLNGKIGGYTGAEMTQEILAGSSIGKSYAESLLLVCRDALARQAQRTNP